MKIAIYYNLPPGGAKRILFEQIKYLSREHKIDVYTLNIFKDNFLSIKKYSNNYFVYKYKNSSKLPFLLSRLDLDFKTFFKLKSLHKKIASDIDTRKYDVVIVHPDVLTEAPYILRFLKTPKVYFCEELLRIGYEKKLQISKDIFIINRLYENFTRIIRKNIDKRNATSSNLILTTSNFMKQKILSAYKKKAIVCYPGVDINTFKKLNIKKENKVLFIGNKDTIDGYDLAVKAISEIPEEIRPKLEVLEFTKAGPKIKDDNKLRKIYASSFLTLCLDYEEPFGLKVLESMACGTPVIAVNDGGYKETVINNKTGYLISRNTKELVNKILLLIKNNYLYKELSDNAFNEINKNWDWSERFKLINYQINRLLNSKNKIIVSGIDSGGFGGSEIFLTQLTKAFIEKKYAVSTLIINKGIFQKFLDKNKISYYLLPFRMDILGRLKGLLKFIFLLPISFLLNINSLLDYKKKEYFASLLPGFSDKITLSLIAKLFGIKCVWIEYAPLDEAFKRNFGIPRIFYLLSLRFCDKYIVPTVYAKKRILKLIPSLKDKIEVIPCGLKIPKIKTINLYKKNRNKIRKELGIKKNEKVIGTISRIEEGKGQDTVIRSAHKLSKKYDNLRYLIVGEGEDKKLINLINEKKLQNQVSLLGFKEDVYKYLAIFDIFVFPTRWKWEGFGLVNLEAMVFGIPVITSNFGPIPEVVRNKALLIKPDSNNLANKIDLLLKNNKLRNKLSKDGYSFVKNNYDIDIIAEKYLKVIKGL